MVTLTKQTALPVAQLVKGLATEPYYLNLILETIRVQGGQTLHIDTMTRGPHANKSLFKKAWWDSGGACL